MKNFTSICSGLLLLALGVTGCSEEKMAPLPGTVPLRMSVNTTDLVMGENLAITFDVTGTEEGKTATNEDINIKLSATSAQKPVDCLLFDGFPKEVVMKAGLKTMTIEVPVKKEGLNKEHPVEISAFVRGYKLEGGMQIVTVSDYHYIKVGIKNNADGKVKEGQTFVLEASSNTTVKEALVISVACDESQKDLFENLPAQLVIPAGEKSVESEPVKVVKSTDTTDDVAVKLTFSVPTGSRYPLMADAIDIDRVDIHKKMDTKVREERWLYEDPDQLFVSPQNEEAVKKWGQTNYVVMKEGDPHPNSGKVLPANKWKFFRAYEFHKIPALLTKKESGMKDFVSEECPFGFADQNTGAVETAGAVDNAKYAYVMDEGYLRMMTLKERAKSTNGGKEFNFGTSAFYANKYKEGDKNWPTWASQTLRIYPGMRIETRARLRGMENTGMLPGIWLQGNKQVSSDAQWMYWPDFGEVDIMENNSEHGNLAYRRGVELTYHIGGKTPNAGDTYRPTNAVTELASDSEGTDGTIIDDFQIYWAEWVDNETFVIGVNGEARNTITKQLVEQNGARWPFTDQVNTEGLYYIITMMFLGKEEPNWENTDMNNSYKAARNLLKVNPNAKIPRMEIDWVRFYIDDTYSDHGMPYRKDIILY